jgi:hypothetical protein
MKAGQRGIAGLSQVRHCCHSANLLDKMSHV